MALRCALDLQAGFAERPFAVRIGIHAGDDVRSGDDMIGVQCTRLPGWPPPRQVVKLLSRP